ncbi:MAG: AAA family ATPase [Planctomycetes bacterium]|nr:AAA family ATPase [Planctomycetota bacterium]
MTDPPSIYDCIEFSTEFRCLDVATENAFMAMDLRYRGHRELADRFVRAYVEASGDAEQIALMPPLIRYRALVRAKVAAIAAHESELSTNDRDNAAQSARRHLRLAAATALEERGRVFIAACGPPASGKSALLETLAREAGFELFQSDRIRKELAGVAPTSRLPPDAYSSEWNDRTYAELLRRGADSTAAVVLLDATWQSRARRDARSPASSREGPTTDACVGRPKSLPVAPRSSGVKTVRSESRWIARWHVECTTPRRTVPVVGGVHVEVHRVECVRCSVDVRGGACAACRESLVAVARRRHSLARVRHSGTTRGLPRRRQDARGLVGQARGSVGIHRVRAEWLRHLRRAL